MSAVKRCFIATGLAVVLAGGVPTLLLAQQLGTISGQADDETDKKFDLYTVRLLDLTMKPPQVAAEVKLDSQERFSFTGVAPGKRYMVELWDVPDQKMVCSEGPYVVAEPNMLIKTDVNIDCDKPPAILWWGGSAAALLATIAIVNDESSSGCSVTGQ